MRTLSGDVQDAEDKANADIADTVIDDAFGEDILASCQTSPRQAVNIL